MRNIEMHEKDGTLTLKVDLSLPGVLTKSGKNILIASSDGCAEVPGCPGFWFTASVMSGLPKAEPGPQ